MLCPLLSRRAVRGASALLLLALLAPLAGAQTPFLYALRETGGTFVNGTQLDKLGSNFDPESPNQNSFERWLQLAVSGADRYALRLDGKLAKNGKNIYKLPFEISESAATPLWVGLTYGASGIYALRQDGKLTLNGVVTVNLPPDVYFFTDCLAVPNPDDMGATSDIYSLRSDGMVFQNNVASGPFLKFTGGPGLNMTTTAASVASDGTGTESVWIALALDPTDGTLLGLRRDGKISGGSSPPVTPPAVDAGLLALPFPSNSDLSAAFNQLNSATKLNDNRYVSLKVDSAGTFLAVRGNGQIFSTASVVTPLVDLPSNGDPAINSLYQDVVVKGTDFWTVRWDGNIYSGLDTVPVLKTPGERFRDIELSDVVPDLTVFKNPVPIAMTYTATVIEHDAVNLPVIVSDIEKSADQLVVTAGVPKKPLPPGLSADPDSDPLTPPVITWNDATPKGTYTVPIVVDDGHNKPKTYNFKVKVILPDTNELKNKKPVFSTVKHTQALVGFPFTLQLFAVDPDEGDTVTLSVDTSKAPFNHLESPALFTADPGTGTGTFTWTPTFDDIGTTQVKFTATDSNATKPLTKTYTVKVKVVSSFLIPPG